MLQTCKLASSEAAILSNISGTASSKSENILCSRCSLWKKSGGEAAVKLLQMYSLRTQIGNRDIIFEKSDLARYPVGNEGSHVHDRTNSATKMATDVNHRVRLCSGDLIK